MVTDLLVENFKDIFDFQYTARLEEELDEIEDGTEKWTNALAEFYEKFEKDLRYAETHMENVKRMEKPTDQLCERCGSPLVIKWGKHGSFFACSAYDKTDPNSCTFTKENPIDLPDLDSADLQETTQEEYCENCGRPMVLKRGRFGQFMACTGYPECKTTRRLDQAKKIPDIALDEKCPQCGRNLLIRHGRFGEFISCSGYPECKYVKQNLIGVKCPECKDGDIAEKKARRGNYFYGCTNYPKCEFTSAFKPVAEECPSCKSPYLLEKQLKDGTYLVCPNNKRTAHGRAEASRQEEKGRRGEQREVRLFAADCASGGRGLKQRRSNVSEPQPNHHDAELILKLYDLRREPVMREARAFYNSLPPTEEAFFNVIANPASKENSYVRQVVGYWEMAASLVVHGTLNAGLAFDTLQEMYFVYAKVKPFLPKLREMTNSPDFLMNMEKLAEGTPESRERVIRVQARIAARFAGAKA